MNVSFKDKKLFVDNKPKIIMAGEIHYYRLHPKDWQHTIDELKNAGMNTVATYIPWVIHEQKEGDMDLSGIHRQQYDIISFMKLVYENGLYFIARPGPFTMAEMVGDGIPPWVGEKYPDAKPTCWEGKPGTTVDLDYLNEGYLKAAKNWYSHIIPEIAKYEGKNLLGIQLDNEMGMLAWVSNSPVLNDSTIKMLIDFMKVDKRAEKLELDLNNFEAVRNFVRIPEDDKSALFHDILLDFYRLKIKKYTEILEGWTKEFGIKDTIYMINVHGTGAGRLYGYPLGLSQLYKTYENKSNYISGSDIYFDSMQVHNIQDTYLSAAMTDALNDENQPLTSLEFNASDSDFGFNMGRKALACTNSHRGRLLLGQGTKLYNFYLFSGGFNDFMNEPLNNGIDRIANTGEKHGYGAPIRHDLTRNYTFDQTAEFGNLVKNLEHKLADMKTLHDNISIAFIPDYYKNEFISPTATEYQEIVNDIKRHAWDGSYEVLVRYLLLRNYLPSCVNVQDHKIDMDKTKVLVINSSKYMASNVQQNLADFVLAKGKLILYGAVPQYDMHGEKCTILSDALKVNVVGEINYQYPSPKRISVTPCGFAKKLPSSFFDFSYIIESEYEYETFLKSYESNDSLAILIKGDIDVALICCDYRCDMELFDLLFSKLNIEKKIQVNDEYEGVSVSALTNNNESFLNVINLDDINRKTEIKFNDLKINLELEKLDAMLLPINVKSNNYIINYANNEIYNMTDNKIIFRLSSDNFELSLTTNHKIKCPDNYLVNYNEDEVIIKSKSRDYQEKYVTIEISNND